MKCDFCKQEADTVEICRKCLLEGFEREDILLTKGGKG